jgi:hypothetical protein
MSFQLYKDADNNIYSYPADGSQNHLVGNKIAVSQEQANAIIAAKFEPQRQEILSKMSYSDKRLSEYPPIGDQLDAIWKGGDAAEAMRLQVQAVKDKYPKS